MKVHFSVETQKKKVVGEMGISAERNSKKQKRTKEAEVKREEEQGRRYSS